MFKQFRKRIKARRPGVPSLDVKMKSQSHGTALYVDTENLQSSAQLLVETVVRQWPEDTPPLSLLNLYVHADRVSLWDVWASSHFPHLTVTVKGIQHFTRTLSKNSADIAIAIDAVADFVTGTTQFVAVMSDDSDFMPLYAKLKDLGGTRVPFLWVMTDRTTTKASTIANFFPNDHIHEVQMPAASTRPSVASNEHEDDSKLRDEMADLIVQQIPVGPFRSVDCHRIVKSRWPDHRIASMQGPKFGMEFANKLWPILKERGVKQLRTKPRKYEMTSEAKDPSSQAKNADSQ